MHAVVTPWPPQRNGIADYAFELTRHARGPVTVVTEAFDPRPLPGATRILDPTEVPSAGAERMPWLYHFGNNADHVFAVPLFLRRPGVAVVHDATLHYLAELVDMAIPGFLDAQIEAEQGALPAAAMRKVWAGPGLKRALDFQHVPLLRWLRVARAIIVHSRFAARAVGGLLPEVPVHVVPHFAYPPPPGLDRRAAQARARLGVGADELMLVVAGFATRNKRYDAILKAIADLPPRLRARVRLVVAGALRPDEFDLKALVARLGCAGQTLFAGYLDDSELAGVLAGADLVLNLRFPSFGESSGSVARAFGLGALVAVSDTAAYAELPDEVCLKLPARADCSVAIGELIGHLAEQPGDGAARRAAAAAWAAGDLHPAAMARRYAAILEAAHG